MPTAGGPNTLGESNLVFAYDTGDVKNSYIGEPTVNITAGTMTPYTPYNTLVRDGQNFTLTMVPGSAKYLTLHNGTNYVGQTLSYSGYMFKNGIPFNPLSTSTVANTYQSSGGMSNQYYDSNTGYFEFTLYFNASSIWLFHQSVGAADNDIIQITDLQVEVKNHITPFTTGTRSSTQGLLPLVGNSTLDLTNVSFDSNAQMVFDGTNDYFTTTTTPSSLQGNSTFSVEGIFKRNGDIIQQGFWGIGGGNTLEGICSWNYILTNEIGIDLWGTSTYGTGQTYSTTEWKHIVWTYNGASFTTSNIGIFVNGVKYTGGNLITRRGGSGTPNINNTGITLGRINSNISNYHASGQIPVFKVYNRIISDNEVKQNYQQYKTRFNLS